MTTLQPTFAFDIERLLEDIYTRHPDMELLEDTLLESCVAIEQTYVFFELPRTSQFREVQQWLDHYYGLSAVIWMDSTELALDAMYRQWRLPSQLHEENQLSTEFGKAVTFFLKRYGTPVSVYESPYGWEDYYAIQEMKSTDPVGTYHIHSDSWTSFVDTYTGSESHSGFSAYIVFDSGLERYVRYEGNLISMLKEITEDI